MKMKLSKQAQAYVESQLNPDDQNQLQVYQVLIEGYWSGKLDMDMDKQEIILLDKPVPRAATPGGSVISGAIMQAIAGNLQKKE